MVKRLLLLLMLLFALPGWAGDLVIIVNPKSGVDKLTKESAINIFLGRFKQLPSGVWATPVDLPASDANKAQFYKQLVGKDLAEINAYWARLVFSGRTNPPRQATSVDEMLEFVAASEGAIGYVDKSRLDKRVKAVLELEH